MAETTETEHAWKFEHKGDESKADLAVSAATTLTGKIKELFAADGEVARFVDQVRGMSAEGYDDPTEVPPSTGNAISGSGHYQAHGPHWILWVLLVLGIITLAAAIGSILAVNRIEAAVERGLYERAGNRATESTQQDTGRHDERIDGPEQQRRDAQRNPDDQQGDR